MKFIWSYYKGGKKEKMNKRKLVMGLVIAGILLAVAIFAGCINTNEESEECPECPECEDCSGINRIYDVNRDGKINFQDAGLAWVYIAGGKYPWVYADVDISNTIWSNYAQFKVYNKYAELLYDVDIDGDADWDDVQLIWENRD